MKNANSKQFLKKNVVPSNAAADHTSVTKKGGFFQKDRPFTPKKTSWNKTKPVKEEGNKEVQDGRVKKPFDKKSWRLKKYSHKYKLEQYEEKRRKAVFREYYKETRDWKVAGPAQKYTSQGFDEAHGTDSEDESVKKKKKQSNDEVKSKESNFTVTPPVRKNYVQHPDFVPEDTIQSEKVKLNDGQRKGKAFRAAKDEFQRLKDVKLAKRAEIEKAKKEREEALDKYKKKKAEKYKRLNKKTKRGQPVMKDRLEMLLEQIQRTS